MWLTFFAAEGGTVHHLAHHPENKGDGILCGGITTVVCFSRLCTVPLSASIRAALQPE